MNILLAASSRSPRLRRSRRSAATVPAAEAAPELRWIHDGVRCRVTVWPEVRFQCEGSDGSSEVEPGEGMLASAALGVTPRQWQRYLEFVPARERALIDQFQFGRLAALQVCVRCAALVDELVETPALVPYLAAHLGLCGGEHARWSEINAIFEREGLFGVLQWLGLPASRQTIAILRHIADPDIPRRLLEPLRAALWEPETIWALLHGPALTDERLAEACHALAA